MSVPDWVPRSLSLAEQLHDVAFQAEREARRQCELPLVLRLNEIAGTRDSLSQPSRRMNNAMSSEMARCVYQSSAMQFAEALQMAVRAAMPNAQHGWGGLLYGSSPLVRQLRQPTALSSGVNHRLDRWFYRAARDIKRASINQERRWPPAGGALRSRLQPGFDQLRQLRSAVDTAMRAATK